MWQDQCKEFVDAVMHEIDEEDYECAASTVIDYLMEHETPDRRVATFNFIYYLNAMAEIADPIEDEYCYCCGRGSVVVQPCPQCGELLCQDCAPPFGGHVCEPD